jgi:hypothetical protein
MAACDLVSAAVDVGMHPDYTIYASLLGLLDLGSNDPLASGSVK